MATARSEGRRNGYRKVRGRGWRAQGRTPRASQAEGKGHMRPSPEGKGWPKAKVTCDRALRARGNVLSKPFELSFVVASATGVIMPSEMVMLSLGHCCNSANCRHACWLPEVKGHGDRTSWAIALSSRLSCSCHSCHRAYRRRPHGRPGLWAESSLQPPRWPQ